MDPTYVELRNGGYYVAGSRISLDSLVYLYRDGASPETIQDEFPALRLEQIYGALAYYLAHQAEIDANIREGEAEIESHVPSLAESNPDLYARLQRTRHELKR